MSASRYSVGVALDVPDKARFLPKPYTPEKLLRELQLVLPQVGNPITIKSLLRSLLAESLERAVSPNRSGTRRVVRPALIPLAFSAHVVAAS